MKDMTSGTRLKSIYGGAIKMDAFKEDLASVLFIEQAPPPVLARGTAAEVEKQFWSDPYAKNLSMDGVEIEVRLGRVKDRCFQSSVSKHSFNTLCAALQDFASWDATGVTRDTVVYFETRDDSLRAIISGDGTVQYMSKQRAFTADYTVHDSPYDIRLSASVEIPVADRPRIETSTRRVTRDRSSYTLGQWRYDLTSVTAEVGSTEYQVEIELVNPLHAQTHYKDATAAATELGCRVRDLIKVLEPDTSALALKRRRRKWY